MLSQDVSVAVNGLVVGIFIQVRHAMAIDSDDRCVVLGVLLYHYWFCNIPQSVSMLVCWRCFQK